MNPPSACSASTPLSPNLQGFWAKIVSVADQVTQRVGERLLRDFGQVQAIEKTDGSLVTGSDQWADQELRQQLLAAFPDHGILSEEGEHCFPAND